jgi:hypothetical protein
MQNELADLCRRVERWRTHGGGRGSRVPAELWEAAARIAKTEGIFKTSRALRLNHGRLKAAMSRPERSQKERRSGGLNQARKAGKAIRAGEFVTLGVVGGPKTVIELSGQRGRQMRIETIGAVDIRSLADAFFGAWR